MSRTTALAVVALCVVATVAGGVAVRIAWLLASPALAASLVFVAVVLVLGVGLGLRSRPHESTTYW